MYRNWPLAAGIIEGGVGTMIEFGPCDRRGRCDVYLTMQSRPAEPGCRIQWLIDGIVLGPPQPPGVQIARRFADGEFHVLELRIVSAVGADTEILLAHVERVRFPSPNELRWSSEGTGDQFR